MADAKKKRDETYPEEYARNALAAFNRAFPPGKPWTGAKIGAVIGRHQTQAGRYRKGKGKTCQIPLPVLLIVAERLKLGLDEILQPEWVKGRGLLYAELCRKLDAAHASLQATIRIVGDTAPPDSTRPLGLSQLSPNEPLGNDSETTEELKRRTYPVEGSKDGRIPTGSQRDRKR